MALVPFLPGSPGILIGKDGALTTAWQARLSRFFGYDGQPLPVFANNAAAKAGGLKAGQQYRTGLDPDTVCVVH